MCFTYIHTNTLFFFHKWDQLRIPAFNIFLHNFGIKPYSPYTMTWLEHLFLWLQIIWWKRIYTLRRFGRICTESISSRWLKNFVFKNLFFCGWGICIAYFLWHWLLLYFNSNSLIFLLISTKFIWKYLSINFPFHTVSKVCFNLFFWALAVCIVLIHTLSSKY